MRIGYRTKIWPHIEIPPFSVVEGCIKKFIKPGSSYKDPLRTASDEEAFYFHIRKGKRLIHTGFIARNLEEFLNIIRTIDLESIRHHFREDDFSQWIKFVLGEEELSEEISKIPLDGENLRRKLIIEKISSRLRKLRLVSSSG
ncbi:MAG: DUF5752 family protein [Candidatus Syntropharchaeia archaeon]